MLDRRRQELPGAIRQGHARRRLAQLRQGRRAFHRPGQRRQPEGGRAGRPRARSSSSGSRRTSSVSRAARRSSSSRTFRCGRSTPNGAGAPTTARRRSSFLKRFGSVSVLNGHIHQVMQKVEGNVTFHTAMSTAFPQPAPGIGAVTGTDEGGGGPVEEDARPVAHVVPRRQSSDRDHRRAARTGRKNGGRRGTRSSSTTSASRRRPPRCRSARR